MLSQFIEKEESIIRKNVLKMGHETSKAIDKAIYSYKHLDFSKAEEIIKNDAFINALEKQIESECIRIIATQHPIAKDLREFLADMNIAKELERTADYAVTIAKIVQKLPPDEHELEESIFKMAEKSIVMLNEVMLDYAEQDAKKANAVALKDDEIDDLEHQLNDKIFKLMQSNPERAVYYTYQLWIIHQLERIGDKVTNIAESVVFLATGKVVNFD